MHRKYHTEGFVLSGRNAGERGRRLWLLTRDLGLLEAQANGLRRHQSKLRPALTNYSFSLISLVRTKSGWRVTGAESRTNLYFALPPPARDFCSNLFGLIRKLLPTETGGREVFETVAAAVQLLRTEQLTAGQLKSLECVTILQILWQLGYLSPDDWQNFLDSGQLSLRQLNDFAPRRAQAVQTINQSLQATDLISG